MEFFEVSGSSKGKEPEKRQNNIHEVQPKETLYSIAKRYGVSVEELRKYNNIGKDNSISAGQSLKIPPRKKTSDSVSVMPEKKNQKQEGYTVIPKDDIPSEIKKEKPSAYSIAEKLRNLSGQTAAVGKDDFTQTLNLIDKNNVIEVIKKYNGISKKESLINMICSEWGSDEKDRKDAVNHIMSALCEKVGKDIATEDVRTDFTNELNDEFDSWGFVSTKKLDEIINTMISDYDDIVAKKLQKAKDDRVVRLGDTKTTSGKLRHVADSVAIKENVLKARPDPILDKRGNIKANVRVYEPIRKGDLSGRTIIVNAGHGGYNPNNGFFDAGSSVKGSDGGKVEEWDINNDIVKKIIPLLMLNGAKVVYMNGSAANIMDEKDKYNADLFLSIHCDSAKNTEISGQRIIYRNSNNNKKLAKILEENLESDKVFDSENCKIKEDDRGLGVLKVSSSIPSILIESGFLSNEDDLEKLQSHDFQAKLAVNLVGGINQYFNTVVKPKKEQENENSESDFDSIDKKPLMQEKNKLTIPPQSHKVQKGETLYSLEKKYGLRAGELAYLNGIDASKGLKIGQTLKIPERFNIGTIKSNEDIAKLLKFSPKFIEDLMTFEGKKDIHKIFPDQVNNPTIGYGHLINTEFESKYYKNRKLSNEEVYILLAQDLLKAENAVRLSIGSDKYESLSQNQKQALVDFVFSRGAGTFNSKHCKKLREGLIEGDFDKAAANITYNRSIKTGEVMNGLTKRRLYEMAMFAGENKSDEVLDAARKLYNEGLQSAKKEKLNQGTIDAYKKDVQSWFDGKL